MRFFYFLLLFLASFLFMQGIQAEPTSKIVLVSVAPHKYFVEKIAGPSIKVELIVPAGASAHTYEPTPKQMIQISKADIWFKIGENFETKAIQALLSYRPCLKVLDLRKNLPLIYGEGCCHHHQKGAADLHFWLSPRLALLQADTILEGLSESYPELKETFIANAAKFKKDLIALDQKISEMMSLPHNPFIMVSHPAYAYFCRDYHCEQISIEMEGKDPTPQQLTKILNSAKMHHIKSIFVQPQYSSKGAKLIAQYIQAKIITLDPYSENYFESLTEIAQKFAEPTP